MPEEPIDTSSADYALKYPPKLDREDIGEIVGKLMADLRGLRNKQYSIGVLLLNLVQNLVAILESKHFRIGDLLNALVFYHAKQGGIDPFDNPNWTRVSIALELAASRLPKEYISVAKPTSMAEAAINKLIYELMVAIEDKSVPSSELIKAISLYLGLEQVEKTNWQEIQSPIWDRTDWGIVRYLLDEAATWAERPGAEV
jgi:hypothetical protein